MNPYEPPRRSLAVCFAGAAFFGVFLAMAWTVVTILASQRGVDRTQQETIGYLMILTGPAAGVLGAIAGFIVGLIGDPGRWLRRWFILGVVGTTLAVAFNAWMLHDTAPEHRRRPPARTAAPPAPAP